MTLATDSKAGRDLPFFIWSERTSYSRKKHLYAAMNGKIFIFAVTIQTLKPYEEICFFRHIPFGHGFIDGLWKWEECRN
jgi:hypothetical protein